MACYTIPPSLAIIIASDIGDGKQAHYAAEEAECREFSLVIIPDGIFLLRQETNSLLCLP